MRSILKTGKLSELEVEDFKSKLGQRRLEHYHFKLATQVADKTQEEVIYQKRQKRKMLM